MNRKNGIILAASALVVLLMASSVLAYGHGRRGGDGFHYTLSQLSPEKQQAFDKITQEYQDKAFSLRQDVWAKRAELQALSGNSNVDPKRISTLVNDIKNLHTKLYEMRKTYADRVENEVGIGFPGRGFGHFGNHGRGFMRGDFRGDCPSFPQSAPGGRYGQGRGCGGY